MRIIIIPVAPTYRPVAVAGTVLRSPQQGQIPQWHFISTPHWWEPWTSYFLAPRFNFVSCLTCLVDWKQDTGIRADTAPKQGRGLSTESAQACELGTATGLQGALSPPPSGLINHKLTQRTVLRLILQLFLP